MSLDNLAEMIKAFFRFLISKVFLINLALALIVAISIPYFTLNYIESYTNNDSEDYKKNYIPVPNFMGIYVDDIDDFIKGKDLRYVINDSVYSDEYEAGQVIRQNPPPFTDELPEYVKPNRRIYLTIVKKEGEYKEVPDLTSDYNSKKLAKVKLEMLGFKPQFKAKSHKSDYVLKLLYKGKEVKPGTKLLKGSVITVVHGDGGGGQPISLPRLAGMTVQQANQALALAGLETEVLYEGAQTAEDSLNFVVYKQNPHPNNVPQGIVSSGTVVSIWAKKPEADTTGNGI